MNRSLWIAATGMEAQQLRIDVIANNLANVNTAGFKKSRADFQDLLYQNITPAGASSSATTEVPTGIQIGHGVRPVATQKIFTQGAFQETGNQLDLGIEGAGFFQVLQPDGEVAYTRSGALKVDKDGNVVTSDGHLIEPSVTIPTDSLSINISTDGVVSVLQPGSASPTDVGNFELARFINPAGLMALGKNLFLATTASGDATTGTPGTDGVGTLAQGFLEMSNVSIVEEMVDMIVSQRAYELNAKSIQASDEMLQQANNVKR